MNASQYHKSFASILILLLVGCSNSDSFKTPTLTSLPVLLSEDFTALRYLKEVEWPKAYAEQDTVLLDRILAEDFQMIDQDGVWFTKQDELDWIKAHSTTHDSFYYEIRRLEILSNGTAVICGTGHMFNDSSEGTYQSSNVLEKRNGEWKAVLSHVSGVKNVDKK